MTHASIITLENDDWQAGILPGTGASLAYARAKHNGGWVDVLRPTAEADYRNPSQCSSFVMLPWCNRIRDGVLRFNGKAHQLRTSPEDGTARHGDVRGRAFQVTERSGTAATLTIDSRTQPTMNWPFPFVAEITYRLDGDSFVWEIRLTNVGTEAMPAGFGHHPYFVRPTTSPMLQIPSESMFELIDSMAINAPIPIAPRLDFRNRRTLPVEKIDDILTHSDSSLPVRISYAGGIALEFYSDALFEHWVLYAPENMPYFAVEPMTNVSDGFNLYEKSVPGSGVFVLEPGETVGASVHLDIARG
jgi:aldose 1-epimerase